jgi:hypothetical protein
VSKLAREAERDAQVAKELDRLRAHGVRWNVTVSSWSNVRLTAHVTQTSFEPGATLRLDATLTEYGLPVERRATVEAQVTRPDGVTLAVSLAEEVPGAFAATLVAGMDGVWNVRFGARGRTHGGSPFTREQLASAAVVRGADRPWPQPAEPDALACLLRCLSHDREWVEWLRERGLDPQRLRECLERCREPVDVNELDRLG